MLRAALDQRRSSSDNDNVHGGATGKFSLIACPPMGPGNYVLVRRDADGTAKILHLGRSANSSPSLNLARIRNVGALMGANEVHILPGF